MSKSSMFLGDTTNVDHAYIDDTGMVVGGSYRPKFIVTGEVDPVENVVVDFSTIKKSIKSYIDDKEEGFDHKLWWYEGTSKGTITFDGDRVTIITPHVKITGPKNIIRVITQEADMNEYLMEKLNEKYPSVNICISTIQTTAFDIMPQMNTDVVPFRYVHGLKLSTSWGCQNIAHGHLSYIAATTSDILKTNILLKTMAQELDNSIFAWSENLSDNVISYESSRGYMEMVVKSGKIKVLKTETTVEHIVDYIVDNWYNDLKLAGVETLFVSEGLSKGANKDII